MSLILPNCIEFDEARNECIATEKGKTFKIINTSKTKIKKVKVDKCLPQAIGEKRCDFLLSFENNDIGIKKVFFIELKGGRLIDAVKQIHATILYLKNEFSGYVLEARIVGSGDVPNLKTSPEYLKLKRLINPSSGLIKSASNKYLEEIV